MDDNIRQPQKQATRKRRRYNAENGAMMYARLLPKRDLNLTSHPIIAETLKPGSLVEIAGPPGSGKTSVLIDIAAQCIMPESSGGMALNVAYIDCDRQFHVNRLISFIQRRYAKYHNGDRTRDPSIDQNVLTMCLERFHYVACDSSEEYSRALELLDKTAGTPTAESNWILLIDMINAFYWLDRTTRYYTSVTHAHQIYSHRTSRFLGEHNTAAIVTRMAFEGPYKARTMVNGPKDAVSCTMDASWKKLVTSSIRLTVGRVGGRRLHRAHRGMSKLVEFQVEFDRISYI